jgi:hypothetical protein
MIGLGICGGEWLEGKAKKYMRWALATTELAEHNLTEDIFEKVLI